MRKIILAAAVLAAGANSAIAASSSGNFNVQVKIATACTVGATAMDFGTPSTIAGGETATSTVSVTCNKGTAYNLSFANAAVAVLTTPLSLAFGANVIPATLNITAGASGSASGGVNTGTVTGVLTATAYPPAGTYAASQTIYVLY